MSIPFQIIRDSYTQVLYAFNIFQYSALKGVVSLYLTRSFICQLHHVAFYTIDGILFLAPRNAAKLDFYTVYLEKCYNRGIHHFELKHFNAIVTCALSDEIT